MRPALTRLATLTALAIALAACATGGITNVAIDGDLRWTRQIGTTSDDLAIDIATDWNGTVDATG